jgi:hypothetical protein
LWLFFPGILFVVLAIWCFWTLGQGKDIIVAFTENAKAKSFFFIAIAFWVYVSWYSARIVAYLKQSKQEDRIRKICIENTPEQVEQKLKQSAFFDLSSTYLTTFPRIIGYACLLGIELAVLQSPALEKPMAGDKAGLNFLLGLVISWGLDDIVKRFADNRRTLARIIFYALLAVFIITAIIVILSPASKLLFLFWTLLILHLVFMLTCAVKKYSKMRWSETGI